MPQLLIPDEPDALMATLDLLDGILTEIPLYELHCTISEEAARIGREGIDLKLWERLVKGSYGAKVRSLNSFENLCVSQAQSFFQGVDFLTFAEVYDALTKKEAEALIEKWITAERTALSIVRPKGEKA